MNTTIKSIVTFETIGDAIYFESVAKQKNIPGRLLPVPHSLSTGCGIAWITEASCFPRIQEEMTASPQIEGSVLLYDTARKKRIMQENQ